MKNIIFVLQTQVVNNKDIKNTVTLYKPSTSVFYKYSIFFTKNNQIQSLRKTISR